MGGGVATYIVSKVLSANDAAKGSARLALLEPARHVLGGLR